VQTKIADQASADRQSVIGVSLDEEMTNLVATQHAFEAASRVLTAVDEMLDTLINRTGTVGR
jgi:flagellar hook-associated protein 1 FlgK